MENLKSMFERGKHNIESMVFKMDENYVIPDLSSFEVTKELGGYNKAVMLSANKKTAASAGLYLIDIPQDMDDSDQIDIFWKGQTRKDNLKECGGSTLLYDLTNGLVPRAEPAMYKGRFGLAQDLLKLSDNPFFSSIKDKHIDFSPLDEKQKVQLLIHVIGDRLIDNWDTHQKQYAITEAGDVVSFDKGHGFTKFNPLTLNKFNKLLQLGEIGWKSELHMNKGGWYYINCRYVRQILKGDIKIDPQHEILQDFFKNCENLKSERFAQLYTTYFKGLHPFRYAKIMKFLLDRIHHVRGAVYQYFGWKSDEPLNLGPWIPTPASDIQQLVKGD